jgi:hypothetical protein
MKAIEFVFGLMVFCTTAICQTAPNQGSASESASSTLQGAATPSPLTIQHSLSFGMASGFGSSSLQSQSFYSTLMQYKFSAPVTLNLNFGLPIYSSFSPYQNLSAQNLQSMNYFKNIPFEASLAWKPSDRLQFNFMVVNAPASSNLGYGVFGPGLMPWGR